MTKAAGGARVEVLQLGVGVGCLSATELTRGMGGW